MRANSFVSSEEREDGSGEADCGKSHGGPGQGRISVVGIGPGGPQHLTPAAKGALEEAEVWVGYTGFMGAVEGLRGMRRVISTGMTGEIDRCRQAIQAAEEGSRVAVISSGDPGVYGMAGLVLQLLGERRIPIAVIPGVTAATAAAASLGAPLMHDFACISLSDLLTPWEIIAQRLEAAARADFVTVLYNPKSKRRQEGVRRTQEIFLRHRPAQTPVGVVREAGREEERTLLYTLESLAEAEVDMLTTIIIGNSQTVVADGRMITPRGYENKGEWAGQAAKVLRAAGYDLLLTVVTDHGAELVADLGEILVGALEVEDMVRLVEERGISSIVDAAHPFARAAHANAREAARLTGRPYLRLERPRSESPGDPLLQLVPDFQGAAVLAVRLGEGPIFLTTGSRTLEVFLAAARPLGRRVIARVLPDPKVISQCLDLGLTISDIVAMEGPFDHALNLALLRRYGAGVMVSKDSGAAGGLPEKLSAAKELGIPTILVQRPPEEGDILVWQAQDLPAALERMIV